MTDPRPRRLAALVDGLTAAHVDGLLVTSLANIRYLTGFSGTSALLFVTPRVTALVTDFRYQTQVVQEVGDLARVTIESQSLWTGLWQQLGQLAQVQVAGFESAHLLHRDFQRLLEAGSRWQWRPTVDLVETLRERKDADEVALIEQAADFVGDLRLIAKVGHQPRDARRDEQQRARAGEPGQVPDVRQTRDEQPVDVGRRQSVDERGEPPRPRISHR